MSIMSCARGFAREARAVRFLSAVVVSLVHCQGTTADTKVDASVLPGGDDAAPEAASTVDGGSPPGPDGGSLRDADGDSLPDADAGCSPGVIPIPEEPTYQCAATGTPTTGCPPYGSSGTVDGA